ITDAGTISNRTGNGSSPNLVVATSQISSTAFSSSCTSLSTIFQIRNPQSEIRNCLCRFASFAKELFQRRIHIFLIVDANADETVLAFQAVFEYRQQRTGRAAIARSALFADLTIAEEIARAYQLIRKLHRFVVVRVIVVAIRKMKRIYVPVSGRKSRTVCIQRQTIRRRHNRSSRLTLSEELLFRHFLRLGVVTDEYDLHVVVFRLQKTHHPEIK